MVKYFFMAALTIACAWGSTQLVVGSEQKARDRCSGEWCAIVDPGGTHYICCPVGSCPTNGDRECKSE